MTRLVWLLAALALTPNTASAFWWRFGPPCGPVYTPPVVVPYFYYVPPPVVLPVYPVPYWPPVSAAPAPTSKPVSKGPRVYTEEQPVRPAGFAEPTAAPEPEPKRDTIPKTEVPLAPPTPAPSGKVELDLPKLPPNPKPADPKPPEPKAPDLKLPELPPLPSVSKYRPDTGGEVSVQLIPVAGKPAGKPATAEFWNYTARRLTLTVDGREYTLPARHSVAVAVGASFTWAMDGGEARTDKLTADAGGVEVVLK